MLLISPIEKILAHARTPRRLTFQEAVSYARALPNPLREDLLIERVDLPRNSFLDVPKKPGLGIEISGESLRRYAIA